MTPLQLIVAVLGFATLGSIASPAQSGSNSDPNSTLGTADLNQSSLQASTQSTAVTDRYLTSVQTELTTKVDSKNASVGQEMAARTTETTKLADGTTLPKGTKLVGRVTQVQPMSNGGGRSMLAMTFDHAELKGGKTIQVRSVMQMVAPPAFVSLSNNAVEPVGVGAPPSTGTRGGLGAGAGASPGGAVGATGRQAGRTAGSAVGAAAQDTRSTLDRSFPAEGGVVASAGENVSVAPKATQLPGVLLSTAGTAYTSGTLLGSGRNVTLESGTRITLGVIAR